MDLLGLESNCIFDVFIILMFIFRLFYQDSKFKNISFNIIREVCYIMILSFFLFSGSFLGINMFGGVFDRQCVNLGEYMFD